MPVNYEEKCFMEQAADEQKNFCKKLCKLTDRIRNKNSPNIINLSLK